MFDISRSSAPVSGGAQVRMLGNWTVQRADGSVVDPGDWRTAKTADLVRLLALAGGRPVPAKHIAEVLWPNSPEARGQASLRTAASQIRQVLGASSVQRTIGGLALSDVWADVVAFRQLVAVARQCVRVGDFLRVTRLAGAADALYAGDLRTHNTDAEWAVSARVELADTFRTLLVDASEAATMCRAPRDAVKFGKKAVERDPYCERASRALMGAYACLGETSSALWEFERVRALLADELGADPAPQTCAVHLSVLRGERLPSAIALVSA
jgi:DNA-binding SARP family transcriptional activator